MSLHVIVTPKARQNILEATDYIAGQSLKATMRFLDQTEASFERLSQMPERFARFNNRILLASASGMLRAFRTT